MPREDSEQGTRPRRHNGSRNSSSIRASACHTGKQHSSETEQQCAGGPLQSSITAQDVSNPSIYSGSKQSIHDGDPNGEDITRAVEVIERVVQNAIDHWEGSNEKQRGVCAFPVDTLRLTDDEIYSVSCILNTGGSRYMTALMSIVSGCDFLRNTFLPVWGESLQVRINPLS